jgi:hypothetical protein
MASLLSGSVGGAIGVGVAYPFDTLSTKAQVSSGKDGKPPSMGSTIVKIFKEEGVPGFFEGVLVTVRVGCLRVEVHKVYVNLLSLFNF